MLGFASCGLQNCCLAREALKQELCSFELLLCDVDIGHKINEALEVVEW